MKKIALIFIAISAASAIAQTHVDGYVKRDGTYVAPHMRTESNNTRTDNYSTQGNVNPYTGQSGTVNPYNQPSNTYQQNSNVQPSNTFGSQPTQKRYGY